MAIEITLWILDHYWGFFTSLLYRPYRRQQMY